MLIGVLISDWIAGALEGQFRRVVSRTNSAELPLTSTKPEGSGLGLFVVHTTLEHHNGQLKIGRSRELGGAEVQLLLPLRS